MTKRTRNKVPNDASIITSASTGDITHVRNSLTGEFGKVYSAKQIADIKAGAVRDYESSLSSFAWTADEYIEAIINE